MQTYLIFNSKATAVKPEPEHSVPGTILGHLTNKGCSTSSHACLSRVVCFPDDQFFIILLTGSPVSPVFVVFVWTSSEVDWLVYLDWVYVIRVQFGIVRCITVKVLCSIILKSPEKLSGNTILWLFVYYFLSGFILSELFNSTVTLVNILCGGLWGNNW